MIPHHSGAILMCREALIEDQRLKDLCKTIIAGQQAEIDQMRALLQEGEEADSVRARVGSLPARMRSVRAAS